MAVCIREVVEANRENQRAEYDLAAQRGMDRWAFWMMWIGAFSATATAVGIFLIYRTLTYTRDAATAARDTVDEARRATAAAVETAAITRQMGQRQLRAYVTLVSAQVVGLNDDQRPMIRLMFSNSGQTSAYKAGGWMRVCTQPNVNILGPMLPPYGITKATVGTTSIFSFPKSGDTLFLPKSIPEREYLSYAVERGDLYVIAYGVFVYEDAFGKERFTNFRYLFGGDYGFWDTGAMRPATFGNDSN
ncbi:MAG TPA: hypothetical protein VGO17_08985 [Aurantimonas sp.]|nr:hypothetical protein [Aurantimonas sp.]